MAQVDGQWIQLVLDSGSAGSVITQNFLQKLKKTVDKPSNINMIGINGDKKKALGEVKNLPITIQRQVLPVNVIVSEATGYDLLVGNDWLTKYKANLSWENKELSFQVNGQTFKEPATCWKKLIVVEDSEDEFEEEDQPQYQLQLEDTQLTTTQEGLKIDEDEYSWDYINWLQLYGEEDEEVDQEHFQQIQPVLELLTPDEAKAPAISTPGLVIKYFDNNGEGRQPARAYETDAGLDLYYIDNQPLLLPAQKVTQVDTRIAFEIPANTYVQIASRSSLAKKGINVVGGVCDAGYTGNIIVQLQNTTGNDIILQKNDKIAQAIFLPLVSIDKLLRVEKREQLKSSTRAIKGFGFSNQQLLGENSGFSVGSLTINQQKQLDKLLEEYQDLFSNELGKCDIVKHEIDTGNERPVRQHAYQRPIAEKKVIREEVEKMLEKGVIRESSSEWTSPIVLVKKKNGETRFCVDYRKLNKITRKDRHPLPRIDDLLDSFQDATCFTTLDLASGYWQIEMDPQDRSKTAFIIDDGIYEFNVMPFGLTNAPATFQRMMNKVFNKIIGNFVVVYLDDLNIYS